VADVDNFIHIYKEQKKEKKSNGAGHPTPTDISSEIKGTESSRLKPIARKSLV
jgi:hypothetical protein